ncbi:MAG TPA: hypothetical protein VMS17_10190 [Gemmataceae bacterium]|nr:hypothetical protein [Gemmataceae bacterium]
MQEAVEFLSRVLADGPMPTTQCYLLAQIEGIVRRALQRALQPAGVRQRRAANSADPLWELGPAEGGKP